MKTKIRRPKAWFWGILLIYIIIGAIETYAAYKSNVQVEYIIKPFLTIVVGVLYLVYTRKVNYFYLLALLFAGLGDYFTINRQNDDDLFLGLISFLINHFIIIFMIVNMLKSFNLRRITGYFVPFIFVLFMVLWLLNGYLDHLFLPVVLYGVVMVVLGALALYNYLHKPIEGNRLIFFSVLCFIIADFLFAIHRFYATKLYYYLIFITALYIFGQYLLCVGMIMKSKVKTNLL